MMYPIYTDCQKYSLQILLKDIMSVLLKTIQAQQCFTTALGTLFFGTDVILLEGAL